MNQLEKNLRNILLQELRHLKKYGVMHLGFRYFLLDGRSFGCTTNDKWYTYPRTEDFFKHLKSYLTQELIYLTKRKFHYVTRANDQNHNQYLTWLKKLELNNSVGVYKFNQTRIDSFFFICEANNAKQRDDLINNMQWLERHVNSLTTRINKLSQNIINYNEVDFFIDKELCAEIFKNCLSRLQVSTNVIDVMISGRQIQLNQRELEILRFLKLGLSNKEIAYKLGLNEKTVHRQLTILKNKFCLNSKSGLITIANSPQLQIFLF